MDVLTLLDNARVAGMQLWVEDGVLRARGNRRHEPLVTQISEHKAEIIAVLAARSGSDQSPLNSGDGTETPEKPGDTGVSSPRVTETGWPSRRNDPVHWGRGQTRRLVGNGFPAIAPEPVPESILATPKAVCPVCEAGVVLPELRTMTGGRCFACWEASQS